MKLTNNWFTSVTEGEGGTMVIVCGRDEIDAFMASGKFGERVEITWPYVRTANGMPDEAEAKRMEEPQEALQKAMEKDKLSILTGVYTGDGARTWIFYTRNIPAFEKDPDWNEYREMCSLCEDACRDVQSDDEG